MGSSVQASTGLKVVHQRLGIRFFLRHGTADRSSDAARSRPGHAVAGLEVVGPSGGLHGTGVLEAVTARHLLTLLSTLQLRVSGISGGWCMYSAIVEVAILAKVLQRAASASVTRSVLRPT